jgi:hypothetical protein
MVTRRGWGVILVLTAPLGLGVARILAPALDNSGIGEAPTTFVRCGGDGVSALDLGRDGVRPSSVLIGRVLGLERFEHLTPSSLQLGVSELGVDDGGRRGSPTCSAKGATSGAQDLRDSVGSAIHGRPPSRTVLNRSRAAATERPVAGADRASVN